MVRIFCGNRRGRVGLLLFVCLVMMPAPALPAQTAGTGALTGRLTDPSGAVVPGVTVTATSPDTGQTRTTTTGEDGTYKMNVRPPRNYRARFEIAGVRAVAAPSPKVTVTESAVLGRTREQG